MNQRDKAIECLAILELAPGATLEDVKRTYRELALIWHPDKNPDRVKQRSTEKLASINEAYAWLTSNAAILAELTEVPADEATMLDLLRGGRKIEAIKLRREKTNNGLKDAKDYVEELAFKHGLGPKPSPPSSGCFIATAACGPTDPDVWTLRQYRDRVLSQCSTGRLASRIYVRLSPPIAKMIAKSPVARGWVRKYVVRPAARIAERQTAKCVGGSD